jgi:phospholipase C
LTNNGPHVSKASHLSVYNNLAGTPSPADYPAKFPGQYTVSPAHPLSTKPVAGTAPVGATAGDTAYDITVVGPNRFLRHFTGDVGAAGKTAQVEAEYYVSGPRPRLALKLTNTGSKPVTFTVTPNHYTDDRPVTHHVPAHGHTTHTIDPLAKANGWYDPSVTVSGDSW